MSAGEVILEEAEGITDIVLHHQDGVDIPVAILLLRTIEERPLEVPRLTAEGREAGQGGREERVAERGRVREMRVWRERGETDRGDLLVILFL